MKDAEALTRKLFENQPLLMVPDDTALYQFRALVQNTDATLLIISLLESESERSGQEEIFSRMLSRLPHPNVSSQFVYTEKPTMDLSWLSGMDSVEHVLICGVKLRNGDVDFPLNKTVTRDQMQILPTDSIVEIDTNPTLKKTMWTEWMKQFTR